jgi:ketosteroid isomerase-like protein
MSEENVETVRQTIEAFNRGDLDLVLPSVDAAIEWHDQRELPGATVHHGVHATMEHLRSVMEDLPGYRIDVEEWLEAEDTVVLCGRTSAHGRASGVQVDRPSFTTYELQAGRIRRVRIFGTRSEALEAAGLSE